MLFDFQARETAFERISGGAQMFGLPAAGIPINEDTALKFGAVFACRRIIAETIMGLPWGVMERDGDNRKRAPEHPVENLLKRKPSPEMRAFGFKEAITGHALLQGNGYAEIERGRGFEPIALWLIDPRRVTPERDSQNRFYYKVRNETGTHTEVPADDMFHVFGPTNDGLTGMSVVSYAREAISGGMAAQRFGQSFFGNGSIPAGVVTHDKESRLDGFNLPNFYESWEKRLKGPGRNSKVMYLDPGLNYTRIGVPPDDAQFIETCRESVNEIARWFRIPPHMLAELGRATFSNIEHQSRQFVDGAIIPWVTRFEQEAEDKLFTDSKYYSSMRVQALMRGDSQARSEYYGNLRRTGALNANEIRALEDMNGIGPDGDVYLVPQEMTTIQRMISGEDNAPAVGN